MAVQSAWYYRLEKHRVAYGSIVLVVSLAVAALGGHDVNILRDIATGNSDLEATNALYLHITNVTTLYVIGVGALVGLVGSVAYMVIVKVAHGKIAKDNFPLA